MYRGDVRVGLAGLSSSALGCAFESAMSDKLEEPLFSPEELALNQHRKGELIATCAADESVLVVGAGLSQRLGYPTWSQLLVDLRTLAVTLGEQSSKPFVEPPDGAENPLRYADCLRSHVQTCMNNLDRYYSFLFETFRERGTDFLHQAIVRLPFRGIVTLNYDPSLDYALANREPARAPDNHFVVDRNHGRLVSEFLAGLRAGKSSVPRRIAHLHGRFDLPSSIVLTERDYQDRYETRFEGARRQRLLELLATASPAAAVEHVESNLPEWSLHRKFLWTLLSSRSVVFIGFSMEDPYFNQMLKTVVNDLWLWDQPSHFAVMALSPSDALAKAKARHLHSEYGVAVVFYENRDGQNHGELDGLIQEICGACGLGGPQEFGQATEELGAPAHEQRSASQWMANVNERMRRRGAK